MVMIHTHANYQLIPKLEWKQKNGHDRSYYLSRSLIKYSIIPKYCGLVHSMYSELKSQVDQNAPSVVTRTSSAPASRPTSC